MNFSLIQVGLALVHFSSEKAYSFQPASTRTHFGATITSTKVSSFSTFLPKVSTLSSSTSASTSTSSLTASLAESVEVEKKEDTKIIGKTIFVLPHNADEIVSKFGSYSPIGSPSILDATKHIAKKSKWFSDGKVDTEIIILPENINDAADSSNKLDLDAMKQKMIHGAEALIAFSIVNDNDVKFLDDIFQSRRSSGGTNLCQFALECNENEMNNGSKQLPIIVGPYDDSSPSIQTMLPWTSDASGKRMVEQMIGLFDRWTSDDFAVALMIFFNQYSESIDWVKYSIDATWEKGPVQNAEEFYNMITKCGDCISKCVADEKCKECLDALTAVDTRDQVASYRTIVSYESELLRDFSFCILQKNNIFGCTARIPTLPVVEPITTFQGKELTKDVAKQILVGHLDDPIALPQSVKSQISWKVAAGANVAYDQFPSQNQIFYEASNGKDMWYDPVFRVETIDGRNVWCKRHYRVREAKETGTFRFSVLDNGVTSSEFWTIVAVADDLSWIVFHYAGAAASVGQRYLGGLVCTKDGELPPESARDEIWSKLQSAGIEPWELFVCDNRSDTPGAIAAGPPPLER